MFLLFEIPLVFSLENLWNLVEQFLELSFEVFLSPKCGIWEYYMGVEPNIGGFNPQNGW